MSCVNSSYDGHLEVVARQWYPAELTSYSAHLQPLKKVKRFKATFNNVVPSINLDQSQIDLSLL